MQYDTSFSLGCDDLGKKIGKIRYQYFSKKFRKKKSKKILKKKSI
jgi:hypothetical protein